MRVNRKRTSCVMNYAKNELGPLARRLIDIANGGNSHEPMIMHRTGAPSAPISFSGRQ